MTKNQEAIVLLREFVKEAGGIRGVIRMRRLQEQGRVLLARIDKKAPASLIARGWLAKELRKHNGRVLDQTHVNELFEKIALDNLEKVLPYFSWADLREQALERGWIEQVGHSPVILRIAVPPGRVVKNA